MVREEAGVTQEQLARMLRTIKSSIFRIENHAEDIWLSTIERFADTVERKIELNTI